MKKPLIEQPGETLGANRLVSNMLSPRVTLSQFKNHCRDPRFPTGHVRSSHFAQAFGTVICVRLCVTVLLCENTWAAGRSFYNIDRITMNCGASAS